MNNANTKTKIHIIMKKNIGILMIILGAIVLVISYFMQWVDNNIVQFSALALMILGLIAHIVITRRIK